MVAAMVLMVVVVVVAGSDDSDADYAYSYHTGDHGASNGDDCRWHPGLTSAVPRFCPVSTQTCWSATSRR